MIDWRMEIGALAVAAALLLAGCAGRAQYAIDLPEVPAGDAAAGQVALETYGCGACHHIPGVPGANALVGPPLNGWAQRTYIAGKLPNEPVYLIEWLRFPQAIEPGTAMPNLDVSEEDAEDMAAYLYSLRDDTGWYATILRTFNLSDITE